MRDFQMREQYGDSYITPTRAYTADELAEFEHEHDSPEDPGGRDLLNELMERDMARYENERAERDRRRIRQLEQLLEENGIEYD
jgi:hypothetical protein